MSNNLNDWNAQTIAEFRKNHGKVGGNFEGAPLLLLRHTGARSGKPRVNPMMYLKDGDRFLVFASKGGADTNPDWYHNLKAHPDVQIEVGDKTIGVHAEVIKGTERDRLYARQASLYPNFAQYQSQTKRVIPVIALIPKAGSPSRAKITALVKKAVSSA
jgi:deazaflavin-dependent oxidoreductase (nitroreductase family)